MGQFILAADGSTSRILYDGMSWLRKESLEGMSEIQKHHGGLVNN